MIKKLRLRFIFVSATSIMTVVILLLVLINTINHINLKTEIDTSLQLLLDNDGHHPYHRSKSGNEITYKRHIITLKNNFINQYFSVYVYNNGNIEKNDLKHIAVLDDYYFEELVYKAYYSVKDMGRIDSFTYKKDNSGDKVLIVFVDCLSEFVNLRRQLFSSFTLTLISAIIILSLIIIISGRVLKPFIENDAKQKEFITNASHDLKTPMTIISADAELIALNSGQSEWLTDIKKQISNMNKLINDLIVLSRLSEYNSETKNEFFSLSDAVLEASAPFENASIASNKKFLLEITPDISFTGNEANVRKLVATLTDNAVKYCDDGGTIIVKLSHHLLKPKLEITNTYKNVDLLDFDDLFDRFYRTDESRNGEKSGHGLGLAIASSAAKSMGSQITVRKKGHETTSFSIVF